MERVRLTKLLLLTILQGSLLCQGVFPMEFPLNSCDYCPIPFIQDLTGVNKPVRLRLHVQVLEMPLSKKDRAIH